jgi:hypothetical protein
MKKTYYIALDTEYVQKTSSQNQLLSWQFCISTDLEHISNGYIRFIDENGPRPKLHEIIHGAFHEAGFSAETLNDSHIVVICHFCPAEIAMLTDKLDEEKVYDLKFLVKNLAYVRKTVLALNGTTIPVTYKYKATENDPSVTMNWSYEFFDTKLIAPAGASSLNNLSKSLEKKEYHKKEMSFYEISHMDWVLKYKKDKFIEYAINDAKATMMAFIELQKNFNALAKRQSIKIERTIGGAAVGYYKKYLKDTYKLSLKDITGNKTTIQELTKEQFSECYHGGRNETYFIGKAPDDFIYFDIDFQNAYPTCLASLAGINWDLSPMAITTVEQLKNIPDIHLKCSYVQANFIFPSNIKYPCLPDYHEKFGLIYPLSGTTYTTAHEILLAQKMGAKIDIIDSKVLQPSKNYDGYFYPFKTFYQLLIKERNKYPKKSMKNLLFKEYANTLYGKVSQNVSKKNTYNLFDDKPEELGDSQITSSSFASNITGMMRAALGELLYACETLNMRAKGIKYLPLNAVTDGALIGVKRSSFSAETLHKIENKTFKSIVEIVPELIDELKKSNLIKDIIQTRTEITDTDSFLEIKSISNKVWTFKTRGSVGYYNDELTLLTKAGHKPPMIEDLYKDELEIDGEKKYYEHTYYRPRTQEEEAQWLLDCYYDYTEIKKYPLSKLPSLKELIYNNNIEDMVNILQDRKINLDFDYKRKPNYMTNFEEQEDVTSELLNLDTLPYKTKGEMIKWRKAADNLRNSSSKAFGLRTNGYRATPAKVHTKIFFPDDEHTRFGEKGNKGVIVQYVIEAYVKNKLPYVSCEYNYNQLENLFKDQRFYTQVTKKPYITRQIISEIVKKKTFVPKKLPDNAHTRAWVRKTLKHIGVFPTDNMINTLIAKE